MKVVRIFAVFLAFSTLGYTAFQFGSELFPFLVPVCAGSLFVLIVSGRFLPHAKSRLGTALIGYAVLAVASLTAVTILNRTVEGGAVLLSFAVGGSLLALRASYVTARRRRYGLSSYYG
jgi:hypothetical protein